ncbi:helix-turn-helix domain-containing protein [Salipiger bermudensis]|uniref:helix-turn-helix domain-containing protein n=1 Tax=Salipiger bermudensis TaxID=344736 RepID=UPI001CD5A879|nr:helix-turn-helix transcriptional regulator [Salipiger bermudensis]MCA1284522.1 helix-turn-helix domain-containing protein [Salipiger bermudensis]
MTLEERIRAQLRLYRRSAGLTQNELAKRIGAHVQQIYRYETGAGRIPAAQLWLISQALDMPLDQFFIDADMPVSEQEQAVFDDVRTAATLLRPLAPEQRNAVIELLRTMAQDTQAKKKAAPQAEQPLRATGC